MRRTAFVTIICLVALLIISYAVLRLRQSVHTEPNLIIVVLDAARADHVGCYGYPRPTTPNIDLLAKKSVLFAKHYCQIPVTTPSTASLFTGQHPDTHRVTYPALEHEEPQETMAAVLKRRGFDTALFSSTPCASPAMGVGTHFEETYYRTRMPGQGRGFLPESLLLQFKSWLDEHANERFFAYVHFLPPHSPYDQPSDMTALFAGVDPPGYDPATLTPGHFEFPVYEKTRRPELAEPPPAPEWLNLYDANLRYGDWAVGEVVQMLQTKGLLDNTVLVITADHGEAFGEHGYIWHSQAIHQEVARIPLLIRFPDGRKRQVVDSLTQTIDLFPTVCDFFGIPIPDGVQGASLLPLIEGKGRREGAYSITTSLDPRKYMVRTDHSALLLYGDPTWRALYDLETDPEERRNIIADRPDEAERLHGMFQQYAETQPRPPNAFLGGWGAQEETPTKDGLPAGVKEQLKALGYVQ